MGKNPVMFLFIGLVSAIGWAALLIYIAYHFLAKYW
jgi:membrane protein DedA with SNARE-associated domain